MENKKLTVGRYFLNHVKKYKLITFIMFFSTSIGICVNNAIAPYIYKELIDHLTDLKNMELAQELIKNKLLFLLLVYLLGEVFFRFAGLTAGIMQTKIIKNITDDCYARVNHYSYDFFVNTFSGSLVAKIKRTFRAFERLADIITWDFFTNILRLSFSSVILFSIDPIFSVILIIWTTIFIISKIIFYRWKMKYDLKEAELDSKLTGDLADGLTNFLNIKLFSRFDFENKKVAKTTKEKSKIQILNWNLDTLVSNLTTGILMIIVEILLMGFGFKFYTEGKISIGEVVLIQSLLAGILNNIWHFGYIIKDFYRSISDAQEMIDIFNQPQKILDKKKYEKCKIKKGLIQFKNVSFAYKKNYVFENLNFTINPGEKIGIVGESGAGKSTLTKLLLRFVDIQSGKILIDNQDISQINQNDLRKNISFVPQEPVLFHRSLFDNIHYGDLTANKNAVYKAARDAQAHQFIINSSKKYDTFVGERGIKLSGGEKQRVAIARAMLKNAPILILDEATSSLDSKAETLIQKALEKLMKNRTTLVIAHRLSTLTKLDRILVFENGKIVENGSHQELIQKSGKYQKLWNLQSNEFKK